MIEIKQIENIVKQASNSVLMPCYKNVQVQKKADGSLITQADMDVQDEIKSRLFDSFPEYQFFSEELSEAELNSFFDQQYAGYWCLDPIDGTSNFASTIPYFSISLALIIEGQTVMGLVYDPVRDECFTAVKGEGATMNGQLIHRIEAPQHLKECLAIVDFKRLSTELAIQLVSTPPYRSQRSFGSVALDWCWLAMGRGHIYLHGKQMLWDYAAGLLIAEESGCVSCTLTGEPVFQESLQAREVIGSINLSLHKQWIKCLS